MKTRTKIFLSIFYFSLLTGFIKPTTVDLESVPKSNHWAVKNLAEQAKIQKTTKDNLTRLAISSSLGDWESCLLAAEKIPHSNLIYDWVLSIQLSCAKQFADDNSKPKTVKNVGA